MGGKEAPHLNTRIRDLCALSALNSFAHYALLGFSGAGQEFIGERKGACHMK